MEVSPQLVEALNAHNVTASDFNTTEEEIMMATDGHSWTAEKKDGTKVTLIKNNNTSFNVQTDRE